MLSKSELQVPSLVRTLIKPSYAGSKESDVSTPARNVHMQILCFSSVNKRHMNQDSDGRVMTTAQDAK